MVTRGVGGQLEVHDPASAGDAAAQRAWRDGMGTLPAWPREAHLEREAQTTGHGND